MANLFSSYYSTSTGDDRDHPRFDGFDKSGSVYRIRNNGTFFGFGDATAVTTLATDKYQGIVVDSGEGDKILRLNQIVATIDGINFLLRVVPVTMKAGKILVDTSTQLEKLAPGFSLDRYLYKISASDCIEFEYLDSQSMQEMAAS
ncbi:MAG: hypothetical protein F6K50_05665 [Moorea sp. SIO3I7]|nr:hypothetical protein [Moorena sp. SIO3I7]